MQESGMWIEFGMGFAGGIAGFLLFSGALARKVYGLQYEVATVKEQLLREKNSRASLTRHKDQQSLELLKELQTPPAPKNHTNPLAKFGISR